MPDKEYNQQINIDTKNIPPSIQDKVKRIYSILGSNTLGRNATNKTLDRIVSNQQLYGEIVTLAKEVQKYFDDQHINNRMNNLKRSGSDLYNQIMNIKDINYRQHYLRSNLLPAVRWKQRFDLGVANDPWSLATRIVNHSESKNWLGLGSTKTTEISNDYRKRYDKMIQPTIIEHQKLKPEDIIELVPVIKNYYTHAYEALQHIPQQHKHYDTENNEYSQIKDNLGTFMTGLEKCEDAILQWQQDARNNQVSANGIKGKDNRLRFLKAYIKAPFNPHSDAEIQAVEKEIAQLENSNIDNLDLMSIGREQANAGFAGKKVEKEAGNKEKDYYGTNSPF